MKRFDAVVDSPSGMAESADGEYVTFADADAVRQELYRLKALLREVFEADQAYGAGFYGDDRWCAAYMKAAEAIGFQWKE